MLLSVGILGSVALAHAAPDSERLFTKYLAACALPEGTSLSLQRGDEKETFAGEVGLAPRWLHGVLDETEQRAVSACLLARANATGAHVPVKIMATSVDVDPDAAIRGVSDDDTPGWRFEAVFFGNVFQSPPRRFACAPRVTAARRAWLAHRQRVCAVPVPGDASVSACGFVLVGECGGSAFVQDGIDYSHTAMAVAVAAAEAPASVQTPSIGPVQAE